MNEWINKRSLPISLWVAFKQAYTGWRVAPQKTEQSIFQDFALINSYLFFTLLDRASFPHYNNTKIIKFGWELFILWVISYGLSFSGFARFPEFRGTINDSFGHPWIIGRVLCSVIRVLPIDLHTTLPNKDLQSRHVIGTEISL